MFVFTRDPNSLGFNSSSHILLGLELGGAGGISAITARFYHGITPGILTCKNSNLAQQQGRCLYSSHLGSPSSVSRIGRTKITTARKIWDG